MINFENSEVFGWEHAIRGMRNPKNSWDKSDSEFTKKKSYTNSDISIDTEIHIGDADLKLMDTLAKAGTDHSKYLRMLPVFVDITAPMYWWKEFDTYKVGTVRNSCSTMHKLADTPITVDDFSIDYFPLPSPDPVLEKVAQSIAMTVNTCELLRQKFNETHNNLYWRLLIQMLPSGYNQKATIMLNYQVLRNMYKSRNSHKLVEWLEFCEWVKSLPHSELITGGN